MKRNLTILLAAAALISLTALGTIIYQRWHNAGQAPGTSSRESRFEDVKRELALTPIQVEQFREIRREFHVKVDSLNRLLEGLNRQLLQEIWQPQPQRIDSLVNRISQLQMESQHLVIWHFFRFKAVLTPEQWEKFYTIVSRRFPGRQGVAGSKQPPREQ